MRVHGLRSQVWNVNVKKRDREAAKDLASSLHALGNFLWREK